MSIVLVLDILANIVFLSLLEWTVLSYIQIRLSPDN